MAAAAALLAACAALPQQQEAQNIYVLDAQPAPVSRPQRDLVIAVGSPRARAGFDTSQIAYERRPHELDYYAKSRWADAPSRMLAPLLAHALEASGGLRGVVQGSSPTGADLHLDTELIRLLQDFSTRPSRVRITVQVQLIDAGARRVLATREFDEIENAPSEDAYGGVIAANRALERVLSGIVEFCAGAPAFR
jgi:cholesterol transport system auxiliary component